MIPTKREQAPPVSPGRIEITRQRLATLFADFSPFGSPVKPVARAPSTYVPDPRPVEIKHPLLSRVNSKSSRTSRLGEKTVLRSADRAGFVDLPDELIIDILSFLPNDHRHLHIASRVNRRLNVLAQAPRLWSNLIERTSGPILSTEVKTRGTTLVSPGTWNQDGVWMPRDLSKQVHYPTLYRSRYLLERVVRGSSLAMFDSPHVDTLEFSSPIYCVYAVGPWLILGGKDRALQIWRVSMGNNMLVKNVENAHDGSVLALAVDADVGGAQVITGSSDGTAAVWYIEWAEAESSTADREDMKPSASDKEDTKPSTLEKEDTKPKWRVDVFRKETLRGHTGPVLDVALAKEHIITCSKDTTIRIYNRHDHTLLRAIVGAHAGPVNCLALHPDPNVPEFISVSGDGYWVRGPIQFPTVFTRQGKESAVRGEQALACVAWGGPFIVTGAKDAQVEIYDTKGKLVAGHRHHTEAVRAIDLDVDGSGAGTIVSASYDNTVVLWDVQTKRERHVFRPHTSIILDVQLTNGRLITASHDQTVQIRTFGQDLPYRDLFV